MLRPAQLIVLKTTPSTPYESSSLIVVFKLGDEMGGACDKREMTQASGVSAEQLTTSSLAHNMTIKHRQIRAMGPRAVDSSGSG